ncbi:MAG: AAA family ATPase [Actinomycetota bacterium]
MEQANLVVVAAPPGSGKTTAIAHLAASETRPVIWYRLASSDADASRLLGHLFAATASAIQLGDGDSWTSADELLSRLETVDDGRVLLVLDEVELLGTGGARLLDELVADLPPAATLMIVGRSRPELNYSLLRVRALLHEHSPDLLRFRSWEIDQLWREVHGVTLAPAEVAELERKTGGWAAGLHLFHLATAGVSPTERRRVLDAMEGRRGPTWEFLKRNVVDALPVELSDFLIETIGLRRLRPGEADELRGRSDSADLLDELARRQLFVGPAGDGDGFVVHDVLRAHLAGRIVHTDGEAMLRERHLGAGRVLEQAGRLSEALDAYARAGAWDAVLRMLEARGAEISGETETMLAERVPDMIAADPWWQLAQARRLRARGRLAEAIDQYRSVEGNDLTDSAVAVARHERIELAGFLTSEGPARQGWIGQLRDVLAGREPTGSGSAEPRPPELMVRGIGRLLSARPGAVDDLESVVAGGADHRIRLVAAAGACLGRWLDADDHDAAAASLQDAVSRVEEPWLVALGAAVLGTVDGDPGPVRDLARLTAAADDPLGHAVATGLAVAVAGTDPSEELPELDSGPFALLDAWSTGLLLAVRHQRGSVDDGVVSRAAATARRTGGGPLLEQAVARRDGSSQPSPWARFTPSPAAAAPAMAAADDSRAVVDVRCFGGLQITVDGTVVDLAGLRPRAREVLRMCAASGGEPVHQDLLCAALWPSDTDQAARKKLHTAVSSVRKHLVDEVGSAVALVRQESTYALDLAGDATVDIRRLAHAARVWTSAAAQPDVSAEEALDVLRSVGLELLPECGAADWVVERRDVVRRDAVGLALALADEFERRGDLRTAGESCEAGLVADRLDARLWTRLVDLAARSGDVAWHAWTTARHQEAMRELDVVG